MSEGMIFEKEAVGALCTIATLREQILVRRLPLEDYVLHAAEDYLKAHDIPQVSDLVIWGLPVVIDPDCPPDTVYLRPRVSETVLPARR